MKEKHYLKTGSRHAGAGQPCQDAFLLAEDGRFAAAVIADGASGCRCGGKGAELTCSAVWDFLRREGERCFAYSREKLAYLLLQHIAYFIGRAGDPPEEFGSTLAAALVDCRSGEAVYVGLGDSAVLGLRDQRREMKVRPVRYGGQPCLTTTENACKAVFVRREKLAPDEILLLCTDGFLQALGHDPGIAESLAAGDFDRLDRALEAADEMDDCSYLAVTGMVTGMQAA